MVRTLQTSRGIASRILALPRRPALFPVSDDPWYELKAQGEDDGDPEVVELHIFGVIGGSFIPTPEDVTGKAIGKKLSELPESVKTIRVLVNSPGGAVTDAQHIHNALLRQRHEHGRDVPVDIEAAAWSAATIITSAGDPIRMPSNATMMVHEPWLCTCGNAAYHRETAEILDKFTETIIAAYRRVTDMTAEDILELMADETWMTAEEALDLGFVTEVSDPSAEPAAFSPDQVPYLEGPPYLDQVPEGYRDRVAAMFVPDASDSDEDPTAADQPGGTATGDLSDPPDQTATGGDDAVPEADDDHGSTEQEDHRMSYLERLKAWVAQGRALLNDEATGDPEVSDADGPDTEPGDTAPADDPADAAEVLSVCREADCLAVAEPLIRSKATREQVEAAVARAKEIRSLCEAGEIPELADGLIDTDMSLEAVRTHVAQVASRLDEVSIDSTVDLDAGNDDKPMSTRDVYDERNKRHRERMSNGIEH